MNCIVVASPGYGKSNVARVMTLGAGVVNDNAVILSYEMVRPALIKNVPMMVYSEEEWLS